MTLATAARLVLVLVTTLVVAIAAGPARSQPGLLVGIADNALVDHADRAWAVLEGTPIAARIDLQWDPASPTTLSRTATLPWLVETRPRGSRIVLAVYPIRPTAAPTTDRDRAAFCGAVISVLEKAPGVRDVIIGNEPNTRGFWQPQFDATGLPAAPRDYTLLLATCYDAIHAFRSDMNVIGAATSSRGNDNPWARSNAGLSPTRFIREMGLTYRSLGRTAPLFDTIDHHPYGTHSSEAPGTLHADPRVIGQGDLDRLVKAYADAFTGTAQATPGRCALGRCVGIWFSERGFQSTPTIDAAAFYSGVETDPSPVAEARSGSRPSQSEQIRAALELAYCQPGVTGYFTFQLLDEPALAGWQAGLLDVRWEPKSSLGVFQATLKRIGDRAITCPRG